jgi:hypothetical protein
MAGSDYGLGRPVDCIDLDNVENNTLRVINHPALMGPEGRPTNTSCRT